MDGWMMGCDGLRWVAMGCDGLRWVAMDCDGLRTEGCGDRSSPGHPETDILVYALRCMMFQAVRTELALMAQLANDMSTSQRCRVRIPRVATVKPPTPAGIAQR